MEKIINLTNTLIDKLESIRGLLEGDSNFLDEWDNEICQVLDALDDLEGIRDWECLQEK